MFQDVFRKFLVEILRYTKNFVQVSIGHCIIENENRVTGRSKIPQECKYGDFWATGGYICGR
jgi:hypothetical protein